MKKRKKTLPSEWSASDAAKGARQAKVWMEFFAGDEGAKRQSPGGIQAAAQTSRIAAIRTKPS